MPQSTSWWVFVSAFASLLVLLLPPSVGGPARPDDDIDRPSSGPGEPWLSQAERLSASWRASEKRRAIELFQKVLALAREKGDAALEVKASVRLGDLHRALGSIRESLRFYDRALAGSAESPKIRVEAELGISSALLQLDDFEGGLSHARRALEMSRALAERRLEVAALIAVGVAHYNARDLHQALAVLESTLDLSRTGGNERAYVESALNLGYAYGDLSEEWRAIGAFERAIDVSRGLKDRSLEAMALLGLGHAYSKIGEKQHAMELYHQARPVLEEMDDPYMSASFYTGMGYLYDELGDVPSARVFYTRALRLNEAVGSLYGRAGNLVHLGRVEEPEEALASFRDALSALRLLGEKRIESVVLGEIGEIQDSLGQEQEALKNYELALTLCRRHGYEREEAEIQNRIGAVDLRRGRLARARRRFRRALEFSRKTESPFVESRALLFLARVERASMRFDEALEQAGKALELVDTLRTKISSHRLRASYVASVYELHAFHVDLLMDLHERRPGAGFGEQAFVAAERAKARSLMEMLSDSRSYVGSDGSLLEYEAQLEARVQREAAAHTDRGPPDQMTIALESSDSLRELLAELDRVRSLLSDRQSARKPIASAKLVGIGELQHELLDDQTGVLAYFLGERASYLWVITRSRVAVHFLPPRSRLESEVRNLHGLLAAQERHPGETAKQHHAHAQESDRSYWRAASSLSETLVGPAMGDLAGMERLLVAGDGVLHRLPFSALPIPGGSSWDAPAPLVARFEVVRLPSVSTLEVLEERRQSRMVRNKKLAVLADPVLDERDPRLPQSVSGRHSSRISVPAFPPSEPLDRIQALVKDDLERGGEMPRLLSTRLEAKRILELVPSGEKLEALGFDASRALVTSGELSAYEVVHFATHGILDVELPELSGIVLSLFDAEGQRQNGFLRLHDIYELDLPVRLVVLSACSTGLGKDVRGEGLVGLVGGFLSTGAQGVIASYWQVDDEATGELMSRFYRQFFERGLQPSKALRLAQTSMWSEKRWFSPRFWGAFELQGDWR
jgi:CHAT domain-containing protein/tetratricopeptide (TPR) repeat protein